MILLNERFLERDEVTIDIEDRGYQFGDGVYEVIRIYNGACFAMDAHIERLRRSAEQIEMILPYTLTELEENLLKLVEKNNIKTGIIYVQVTRGAAPRAHHFPEGSSSVLVAYVQSLDRPLTKMRNGVKVTLTEDIRWKRCDIKSLNLLGSVLAKQKAKNKGFEEAILHRDEVITEGSSTNVFIIKDQAIYTHPANNLILNGITRNKVLKIAREKKFQVVEEPFTIKELLNADEIFITSTTIEITPVIEIDQTVIAGGQPGPVTCILQKEFDKLL
ncbi:D-amino-acid transaminase [Siminovitchia terrae]|uniref:D-amino-acid transaminase n=1 Tax=Siminovitchia terrae TaxID=1914933 RepID=UPI001B1E1B12|nr:D-amino-acid transaminase [Siminovitchia terrae]GIN90948.1 D-alanine aminotransferase [Siminovitchia terrae]